MKGTIFTYHGNESSVPPEKIAMAYAKKMPYSAGMPGPSFTWSAFANSANSAIDVMRTDRIMTIVTERLDESLVAARHYLGWSLADVVITHPRKALSTHPKYTTWPPAVIEAMQGFLQRTGEIAVYTEANKQLDVRIKKLKAKGIDFDGDLQTLKVLKTRVTEVSI